eukprot:g20953.t1
MGQRQVYEVWPQISHDLIEWRNRLEGLNGLLLFLDFWKLTDVTFIDSVLVTESVNSSVGDDDKIYFFFTEKLSEENAFDGKPLVTRVARVCK